MIRICYITYMYWKKELVSNYYLLQYMDKKNVPENIDAYIAEFPLEIQATMNEMRNVIREIVQEATEDIS